MIIEFNTDYNIPGKEELIAPLSTLITDRLERFADEIKKIEVHLSDEDGPKDGANDKRCLLEAHLEAMNPIIATNHADTHELALTGAIDKLKASLASTLGRLKDRNNS